MPDLLFQRQDDDFEVTWAGRAGQYLDVQLAVSAARFPPRQPTPADYDAVPHSHTVRSNRIGRQVQREQRIARGLCIECPNAVESSLNVLRCAACREKAATKEWNRRETRDQRLGRCSRCNRRPREENCGLCCRLCWNSADRAEGVA